MIEEQMENIIRTIKEDGVVVVEVKGDLNVKASDELLKNLERIQKEGNFRILLDLEMVNFIGSMGLGAIAVTLRDLRKHNGILKLTNLKEDMKEKFEIANLTKQFEIYEDREEAVKSFG